MQNNVVCLHPFFFIRSSSSTPFHPFLSFHTLHQIYSSSIFFICSSSFVPLHLILFFFSSSVSLPSISVPPFLFILFFSHSSSAIQHQCSFFIYSFLAIPLQSFLSYGSSSAIPLHLLLVIHSYSATSHQSFLFCPSTSDYFLSILQNMRVKFQHAVKINHHGEVSFVKAAYNFFHAAKMHFMQL